MNKKENEVIAILDKQWSNSKGRIDGFTDEIILMIDNERDLYERMAHSNERPSSIAWSAILKTVNLYLKWYDRPDLTATRATIDHWYDRHKLNLETDFSELTDHIRETREELLEYERSNHK